MHARRTNQRPPHPSLANEQPTHPSATHESLQLAGWLLQKHIRPWNIFQYMPVWMFRGAPRPGWVMGISRADRRQAGRQVIAIGWIFHFCRFWHMSLIGNAIFNLSNVSYVRREPKSFLKSMCSVPKIELNCHQTLSSRHPRSTKIRWARGSVQFPLKKLH